MRAKCYFCRVWFNSEGKIRVDPTEGPSEYTEGHICPKCERMGRHKSLDTAYRLGNPVEYSEERGHEPR